MYTVIIVTHDQEVRERLTGRIDWCSFGFELTGTYTHGYEAWQASSSAVPDLIVSDIDMPVMDGLELAERVYQHAPSTRMILLTGFDQFDYARRAMKYQVNDFICKPIILHDIRMLLSQIRHEWNACNPSHYAI